MNEQLNNYLALLISAFAIATFLALVNQPKAEAHYHQHPHDIIFRR